MAQNSVITAEDRKMRLPWWGVLCVMLAAAPLFLLFLHFRRFDLALPSLISVGMVAVTIALRWKLRRQVWFWITVTILAALHLPVILFFPWSTKWVPALVTVPIGMADVYVMLWVISVVGKFVQGPRAPDTTERIS